MKALILAAGRGSRLWPYTVDRPKCLLHLDGASILDHQLQQLERISVCEVVLVCGFGVEQIRAALVELDIEFDPDKSGEIHKSLNTFADNQADKKEDKKEQAKLPK